MARWKHSTGCPGVSLRGQTYYARYTIPKDVRDKLGGRTERWQSLKTSDLREARSRADLLIARWKAEVAEARGDQAAEQRIKEWQSVRSGYVEARELWTQ
ncbi:MAG: hypothetical protein OIF51_00420, partial [Cellvibrionaceae bacterium]|nr:hypothetical protein [Cellvibrionaceae bacterium]